MTAREYRKRDCCRVLQSGEQGHTEPYIICPGAIVGPSSGPVPSGSAFIKLVVQIALGLKKSIYIGEGENLFYMVDIPLLPVTPFVFTVWLTHLIVLGASGRPRRSLQARLCAYSEPCGRQGEPVLEVLHRRQHALLLETHYDSVWCHPCPQRQARGWHGAERASFHCSASVRMRLCHDA